MNQQRLLLSKDQIILRLVLLIPVLLLLIGPILLVPTGQNLIPCAFHEWTGLSCPGCGLTRSFHATSLFNFGQAIGYHLLGPLFMIGLLFITFILTYEVMSKKQIKVIILQKNKRVILYSIALLWFGFWIYRMSVEGGLL